MTRLQSQPADMIIFCKGSSSFYFYCGYIVNWYVNLSGVCCVKLICECIFFRSSGWWKPGRHFLLQSDGGGGGEHSPLHDTSCSQGGWISPVCTRHFRLQEKGRGIEPEVQVKANTITLISHGECCSCMCVTHNQPQSQLGSPVINHCTVSFCIPHYLDSWPSWDVTPWKITGCVYRE